MVLMIVYYPPYHPMVLMVVYFPLPPKIIVGKNLEFQRRIFFYNCQAFPTCINGAIQSSSTKLGLVPY